MSPEREGRELAERTRQAHDLGLAPIADFGELLEGLVGADVAVLDLPPGHDGLTRKNPRTGDIIVAVNRKHAPERQRFTLAHELGHILVDDLHDSLEAVHEQGPHESRAHAFARNFLLPQGAVLRHSQQTTGLELVSDLIRLYGVSPQVAVIQLEKSDVQLRDEVGDRTAGWFATRFGWDSDREGQVARAALLRPPRGIVAAATAAYEAGVLDRATLARIRKENVKTLGHTLEQAGITPRATSESRDDFEVGDEDW